MLVNQPNAKRLMNDLVSRYFRSRPVAMLEAGGGSHSKIDLSELDVSGITTLDISPEALAMNTYADEKILGDLQEWQPGRQWNLVVVFNVLEHIPHADRAIDTLAQACAPDGLIVVGGPVARAFSGLVTSFTPHWFHVFFYRFALGKADAGKPGHAPFLTHFHPASQPDKLEAFLQSRGFDCVFRAAYEGNVYRQMREHRPFVGLSLMAITGLINALTPKSYNSRHGDFCAIFRKRLAAVAADSAPAAPAAKAKVLEGLG
jgi:SAM-dependent methyltransferase